MIPGSSDEWFIETYQLTEDRRWRGIVEVVL